jgi:hypothetical protein
MMKRDKRDATAYLAGPFCRRKVYRGRLKSRILEQVEAAGIPTDSDLADAVLEELWDKNWTKPVYKAAINTVKKDVADLLEKWEAEIEEEAEKPAEPTKAEQKAEIDGDITNLQELRKGVQGNTAKDKKQAAEYDKKITDLRKKRALLAA